MINITKDIEAHPKTMFGDHGLYSFNSSRGVVGIKKGDYIVECDGNYYVLGPECKELVEAMGRLEKIFNQFRD
jgi:hypothetical protein